MTPMLLPALLLQDDPTALVAGFLGTFIFFGLALYAYTSFCMMKIAERTNTENGWWAWIPILNILLLCNIARKPLWWILLMLIPLVNIVIAILLFVGVCEARGKPGWWVVLMLLPVVNLVILGVLAFGE
jgi:hypothetical protein